MAFNKALFFLLGILRSQCNNCYVSLTEKVTKYCDENGDWYKHPENNRTWSNYTMCNAFTPEKLKVGSISHFGIG